VVNTFNDVYPLDGVRTPRGDHCGTLGSVSPTDLGIKVVREALRRSGVNAEEIVSVVTGNTPPRDQDQFLLPRHAGLYAGVPSLSAKALRHEYSAPAILLTQRDPRRFPSL